MYTFIHNIVYIVSTGDKLNWVQTLARVYLSPAPSVHFKQSGALIYFFKVHFQCRITVIHWFLGKHFWWEKSDGSQPQARETWVWSCQGLTWQCQACAWGDHWAFWTPGTLAAAAAAAPLGEGGDRRGRRMESSDEEGWVWGVFTGRKCELCTDLCSSCLASAKRCHLIPSSPTDPNLPMCPHAQATPTRARSWGWLLCHFPVGMWVPASSRNKAPEKSKCYKKMQNLIWKSLSHCSMTIQYCMWYHSSVCTEVCWMQALKGTQGPSAPGICRNAPFVYTHPLPPPHAHPTPHAKAPNRENKATCHCSPYFW